MEMANQNTSTKTADNLHTNGGEVEQIIRLEVELERMSEELSSEQDRRLRLAAEFDNYRKRVRRERAEAAEISKRELLERLITIADDLDLALANVNESPDAVAEALSMIRGRFYNMLEANGVEKFESKGEIFDPERHEAFDVIVGGENESGTVHTEIRRGYFWHNRLLRPALVVVAQ